MLVGASALKTVLESTQEKEPASKETNVTCEKSQIPEDLIEFPTPETLQYLEEQLDKVLFH